MRVSVRLFGPLRRLSPEAEMFIDLPESCSASALRTLLEEKFRVIAPGAPELGLLKSCAIADGQKIFRDGDEIVAARALALVPPVSGG